MESVSINFFSFIKEGKKSMFELLTKDFPILWVLGDKNDVKINSILSNSFGFGGTNASIYLTSYND